MQLAATARPELKRRLRGSEMRHKRSQTKGKKPNSTAWGKSGVGVRRVCEAPRMDFSIKILNKWA